MKKAILIIFTGIILGLFILIMNSGEYLKRPFGNNDDVDLMLQNLEKDIITDNWDKGINDIEELKGAWNKVLKRIQFSVERDNLMGIDLSIARLNGSIRGKNKVESLIGFEELKNYWDNLGK
ncbi:hypothetical protein SH1V18_20030 [Vallitalea longa]|uniref:DUF4363 family protein n=1 Tax=Vallitalea longa TaxID=2936439 RepID=A0A9W6DFJ8_9FIRM|nr:DUF4363 family protein [Vallitalea longa]GKX29523.1 hypothetical protein SH1V18_20030 [Vallitalea longa]